MTAICIQKKIKDKINFQTIFHQTSKTNNVQIKTLSVDTYNMKYPYGKFVGYDDLCKRMDIHCILTINKQNKKIKKNKFSATKKLKSNRTIIMLRLSTSNFGGTQYVQMTNNNNFK